MPSWGGPEELFLRMCGVERLLKFSGGRELSKIFLNTYLLLTELTHVGCYFADSAGSAAFQMKKSGRGRHSSGGLGRSLIKDKNRRSAKHNESGWVSQASW